MTKPVLCSVCFRQHREPGSTRCADCDATRKPVPRPQRRPLTRLEHAEVMLGGKPWP